MKVLNLAVGCLSLLGVHATVVNAQTVLRFNFGTSATPTALATTLDSNISSSSFTASLGSPQLSSSSPGSTTAGGSGGSYFTASNFRSSDGNYFEFTVTPASGYQVTLTNFSLYYLSTTTGPTSSTLTTSANSYSSNLTSFSLTRAATSSPTASDWKSGSSSITLSFTEPATFRISGTGASASTGAFRVDDVLLQGSVSAIPEPSTYAAIAGASALVGAMWWRRRQTPTPLAKPGDQAPIS